MANWNSFVNLFKEQDDSGEDNYNPNAAETFTVMEDSEDGTTKISFAEIDEDGNEVPLYDANGEELHEFDEDGNELDELAIQSGEVPTIGYVAEGDTAVAVPTTDGGYVVVGSAGWGDEVQATLADNTIAAEAASIAASAAETTAEEAQAIAEATNQHFWTDDAGIHVTFSTQEEFEASATGHNLLENSEGILLREGTINLSQFSPSAVAFYDGQGNESSNVVASFGNKGAFFYYNGEGIASIEPAEDGSRIRAERFYASETIRLGDWYISQDSLGNFTIN